jgi:site-specific DNA-methyltransferase (adenine-specific)
MDLIFADPPYNVSGKKHISVRSGKRVVLDMGDWDRFAVDDYAIFCRKWLEECKRVLSNSGTIWISGTLHSHPTIGFLLKQLDFWIINDVIWYKPNAPPLLSSNRFVPSTELIWVASKSKKYFFNYELAKKMNRGKQLRNLWNLPATRHKTEHPTEKPESLLERIILIGSMEGGTVLDPFMGSGTTGVVAKRLSRRFVGIEIGEKYFEIARRRIERTRPRASRHGSQLTDWIRGVSDD